MLSFFFSSRRRHTRSKRDWSSDVIPTTDHASLNLAQAVLIALYEVHLAAGDATRVLRGPRKEAPPPTTELLERYFDETYRALDAIQFFKTRYPEHIMRSMRAITYR